MFTQIINSFLNTRNHVQNKSGTWIPVKEPTLKMANSGKVAVVAATDIVLFNETGKKVILDTFEFTINGSGTGTHPILHIDGASTVGTYDGQLFHTFNSGGGGSRFSATPERIIGDGSTYFEILEANSTLFEYKFAITKPIELPSGGRLALRPSSGYTTGDFVQYKAVYRVWE